MTPWQEARSTRITLFIYSLLLYTCINDPFCYVCIYSNSFKQINSKTTTKFDHFVHVSSKLDSYHCLHHYYTLLKKRWKSRNNQTRQHNYHNNSSPKLFIQCLVLLSKINTWYTQSTFSKPTVLGWPLFSNRFKTVWKKEKNEWIK